MKRLAAALFVFSIIAYGVYSYTQTDPNLVLTSNTVYWSFQQRMWQIGYHEREASAWIYSGIIVAACIAYGLLVRVPEKKTKVAVLCFAAGVLLFSYPALSHDVFNYIFNAKMVVVYRADPHVRTALEFGSDAWTRFMHNTHTPAPYWYGWTVLSLFPFVLGMQKFTLTLLLFRVFMYMGFAAVVLFQEKLAILLKSKTYRQHVWLFLLNPLVLIELLGNVHNDSWMLAGMFAGFYFMWKYVKKTRKRAAALSILAFLGSASIKYATVAVFPVVLGIVIGKIPKGVARSIRAYWAELSALLLFIPLLTDRAQQFHPWYLVWSLSFVPFMKLRVFRTFLLSLSVSSMFRYVPYLLQGDFSGTVVLQEKLVTWVGGIAVFVIVELIRYVASLRRFPHARMTV